MNCCRPSIWGCLGIIIDKLCLDQSRHGAKERNLRTKEIVQIFGMLMDIAV